MIVPTMPPATFTVKGWPDSSWNGIVSHAVV